MKKEILMDVLVIVLWIPTLVDDFSYAVLGLWLCLCITMIRVELYRRLCNDQSELIDNMREFMEELKEKLGGRHE